MNSDVTANAFRYSVFGIQIPPRRYGPFVERLIRRYGRGTDYSPAAFAVVRERRFKESIINFPRIAIASQIWS